MTLKSKLIDIKMRKDDSMVPYLTRVTQIKYELGIVGEFILDTELVWTTLKHFTKEWEVFVKCIVGRDKLIDWSRLWDDFTQEEIRVTSQSSG